MCQNIYIDGLVQERCNSSASAMELRLSCTEPLICIVNENKIIMISNDMAILQIYFEIINCCTAAILFSINNTPQHCSGYKTSKTIKNKIKTEIMIPTPKGGGITTYSWTQDTYIPWDIQLKDWISSYRILINSLSNTIQLLLPCMFSAQLSSGECCKTSLIS